MEEANKYMVKHTTQPRSSGTVVLLVPQPPPIAKAAVLVLNGCALRVQSSAMTKLLAGPASESSKLALIVLAGSLSALASVIRALPRQLTHQLASTADAVCRDSMRWPIIAAAYRRGRPPVR